MFFSAAKLFWFVCAPSHLLLWCLLAGAGLLLVGRRRAGTAFTLVGITLLIGLGVVPSYIWLGRALEHQYDALPRPAHADGILVLGGGEEDIYRLSAAAMLARRYPDARLVFSGGADDARNAKTFLLALGLAPSRLVLENRARDTFENFAFSKALVTPQRGQTWILMTSAYHLPRALAVAKRQGWTLFPWPTNHLTPRHGLTSWWDFPHNLQRLDAIAHEQIGLFAYRWSSRT